MALDKNAFIANFLEEAAENLAGIESHILILKHDPENQGELTTLLRELHTLKGSSRMLKFPTLEKISHSLENVFKGIKEGRYSIHPQLVQLVLAACDQIRLCLDQVRTTKDDTIPVQELLDACAKAYANEPFNLDWQKANSPSPSSSSLSSFDGSKADFTPLNTTAAPAAPLSPGNGKPDSLAGSKSPSIPSGTDTDAAAESVRVKLERVDELLKMHNDLITKQFQLKREKERLGLIEDEIREALRVASEAGSSGKARASPDLSRLQNCLNMTADTRKRFSEHFTLMERSALKVQRGLLGLMMLPVDLILGPIPRMVEETASDLGKEVELVITGSDLGMDRLIMEHLRDPLIHLIRNAVDHGIEAPEVRKAAGKAPRGKLEILCSTDSGSFIMRIRDDGNGLDYDRIRAKARRFRPERADEIDSMDRVVLNQFLFEPGFTTRDTATELSGRGLGLDIVRHQVEQVKGKITLSSETGKGTEFVLCLPLSLATVNGFFVRIGPQRYLMPGNYIQEVTIIKEEDKINLLNRKAVPYRDKIIPVYHLGDILEEPATESQKNFHAVVVEYLGETIGITVDQIEQYVSLVYKPLPKSLAKNKALQGFVFDENFDFISILSVPELIEKFKRSGNFESRKRFSEDRPEYKRLLVVDDSFSTREIEKSILEFEGYNVETAVDGIEALEMLKTRSYHLIVTDLNMPRMDGATLVANLRRDEKYRTIPVIVVSSEKDREKRQQLMNLGADSFIDKADFDRGNLAGEVRYLLAVPAEQRKNKEAEQ